jgi:hypothetical protein
MGRTQDTGTFCWICEGFFRNFKTVSIFKKQGSFPKKKKSQDQTHFDESEDVAITTRRGFCDPQDLD